MTRFDFRYGFLTLIIGLSTSYVAQSETLILVPGTGNSLMGQYFHSDIVNDLKEEGWNVVIATELSPFGGYEVNGLRLAEVIRPHCGTGSVVLVGHSAGGLYGLAMLDKAPCRIRAMATIGTPFLGLRSVEALKDAGSNHRLRPWIGRLWVDMRTLKDFEPEEMAAFYKKIEPLPPIEIHSFAGVQALPHSFSSYFDAETIFFWMVPFQRMLGEPGDGLISESSALGVGLKLNSTRGPVSPVPGEVVPLDHVEQIWGGPLLNIGFKNRERIREHQRRLYKAVSGKLKKVRK